MVGKNFIRMILLLAAVSVVTFTLVSISPIDPLQANVGQTALGSMSEEQIEKLQSYWGVDTPPLERYLNWAKDFVRGDMGVSLLYRQSVSEVIKVKLGNSLFLLVTAWLISGLLGFLLGILAGVFRGTWIDRLIKGYSLLIASTPVFWLALLLLLIFSVWLKIFPIGLSVPIGVEAAGVTWLDRLYHAVLPAITLSITGVANIAMHTREKMIDVMESDYMLFATARGESKKTMVIRHGLRNIALPAMTLQFASISEIIGGSVLVEQVFSYPGLGQAAVAAGTGSDVPLLLGITVVTAASSICREFSCKCTLRTDRSANAKERAKIMNQRKKALIIFAITVGFLTFDHRVWNSCYGRGKSDDFSKKIWHPCLSYLFGTDWLGRDMLLRTFAGLSMSIRIGLLAAGFSAIIAFVLGVSAAVFGGKADAVISFVIDMIMGIPHILLLLLISYALGKGVKGVVVGVALSHWPSLARVIRAEVLQLKNSTYIQVAEKLGHSKIKMALKHMTPHIFPQFLVGLILMFPHAILHEAGITFLGFGLPAEQPAIGIILSESMKYLITGKWWLAVFPGAMLVFTVILFDVAGSMLRKMLDPSSAHE